MSDFTPGLEGVVAFETEIAEPDREGSALRYRGVDIEELVGHVSYGHVWGLLVDNSFEPGLPPAEPYPIPVHSGDIRVDVQSALAMLAPAWGMHQLLDISDQQARDDLARASVMALSFVAQAARGLGLPMVPHRRAAEGRTAAHRVVHTRRRAGEGGWWASASGCTAARARGPGCSAGRPGSSAPRGTRWRRRWRRRPWPSCTPAGRTGSWPRTSSSGRPWSWTSLRYPRTCSPRCSPARGPRAGRPTSWSRSRPAA